MSRIRSVAVCLVLALAFVPAGCGGGEKKDKAGGDASAAKPAALPEAFAGDTADAAELAIGADGGGVAVRCGEATAAVSVLAGSAPEGATWFVTPLAEAPAGVERALCPGIYVDTTDAPPTGSCAIGFALPGSASPDATIVKLADDGTVEAIVPTARVERDGMTLLTAYVEGFSAYTTAEEDAAARDAAFVERAQARGQQVDWTIKVVGDETQNVEGWTFDYSFDLFASGGDVGKGGLYTGYAILSVAGKYEGPESIVQSFGTIAGSARDDALTFYVIEASLASLLTGEDVGDPFITGTGVMKGTGFGSLNIQAYAPNVSGSYDSGLVEGSEALSFSMKITGEDVALEIPNVGIFPGKILRTTK